MSSKYPYDIDFFTEKHNETGSGDGDYVMAEDINYIQDAIVAIQNTLGINPQGSSSSVSKRLLEIDRAKLLTVPKITIYKGNPRLVNGAVNVEDAARCFSYFTHVILAGGNIDDSQYINNAKAVIDNSKAITGTSFYGYIDAGWGMTPQALGVAIDKWMQAGIDGIYLDNLGYNNGLDRATQNAFLDIIHNKGLSAIVYAENTDDIFGTQTAGGKNPEAIEIGLTDKDAVLLLGFGLGENGYQSPQEVKTLGDVVRYRSIYGCKIYAIGYINELDQITANNMYQYGQALAMTYSLDAFHAIKSSYYYEENTVDTYPFLPLSGSYYDISPMIIQDGTAIKRSCGAGEIRVDLENHTYSFDQVKIPLRFIDLEDGTMIPGRTISGLSVDVVAEINNNAQDSSINPKKINFNEEAGRRTILAMNLLANLDNEPKISSGVLGPIDSSKIQNAVLVALKNNLDELLESGEFSGNFKYFTANIVSALNLYAENLTSESMQTEYLNGKVIRAGTIKADMIGTNEITSDKLSIHANSGLNKWAGTIIKKQAGSATIPTPTVTMVLGKDIYRTAEILDDLEISTFDAVGSTLTYYIVMWQTSVFCTEDVSFTNLRFKADSPATLYVNDQLINTTSNWDTGVSYTLSLRRGWNKITVVQDHGTQASCRFSLGIKLSERALQTEKGNDTRVARVDAYAEKVTQITGDYIKTGSITADNINTEGLSAKLVETGLVRAIEAYIERLIATEGSFEKILSDMLKADFIDTSNIRITSQARTTLTDPLLEGNTGVLMIDNGGLIVSSKPKNQIIAIEDVLTIIGDYTYTSSHEDWVMDQLNPPIIYLREKATGTIKNIGNDWYVVKYREGNIIVLPDRLSQKGIDLGQHDILADYSYYSPTWPSDARLIKLDRLGLWISENGGGNWTSKITGAGLRITGSAEIADAVINNAHIRDIEAGKIEAGQLDLDKGITIKSQDGYVYFDGDGLIIRDNLENPLKLIKISKDGIMISQNGGESWETKLSADKLFIRSVDVDELSADKLITSALNIDTIISVGDTIQLDGRKGIKVLGNGMGIEITEGNLQVFEGTDRRVLIGKTEDAEPKYGVQIFTTDNTIALDKDGLYTSNGKFKIKADGTIEAIDGTFTGTVTATSGTFTGTVNASSGRFGDEESHIEIDRFGLVLNTGSIVDTRVPGDQKLRIDSEGIIAKAGMIGGLEINSTLNALIAKVDGIEQYSLAPGKVTVSGNEAITINTGSLIVKNGSNTYVKLGLLDDIYGLRVNLFDVIGAENGKYIQLDQAGLRAFNGTVNTFDISRDGNVKITGEIEANTGKLGNLSVTGTITVGSNGFVVAGPVTLSNTGLTGPGFELKSSTSKIGGWIIGPSTISSSSGAVLIDSANEKIITDGVVFGKYDSSKYGIKAGDVILDNSGLSGVNFSLTSTGINATGGKIGGWNISSNRLYTNNISIDSSAQTITIADGASEPQVVLGKYDDTNYGLKAGTGLIINSQGITATQGTIGGWNIADNGLSWVNEGHHIGIHLNPDRIWLGHDFSVDNATILFNADGSGRIGAVEFNKAVEGTNYSIYTPNFTIDTNGNVSLVGNVVANSGTFNGTIHATAGWFGQDENNSVAIDGTGLRAGNVQIKNNGITVPLTDASGAPSGILAINEAGLVINEGANGRSQLNFNNRFIVNSAGGMTATSGKIANWNISTDAIYTGTSTSDFNILIDSKNNKIQIRDQVTIGLYDATNYGIKAGSVILNAQGMSGPGFSLGSSGSSIAGWSITPTELTKGDLHFDSANSAIWTGASNIALAKIRLNSDGSGKIGSLTLNTGGYTILSDNFKVDNEGNVTIVGDITANSGTFTGTVHATSGWFGEDEENSVVIADGGIKAGEVSLNKEGLFVSLDNDAGTISLTGSGLVINETAGGATQINLNNKFIVDSTGGMTANFGTIGGWTITETTISSENIVLDSEGSINIGTTIELKNDGSTKIGKLTVATDGSISSNQFSIDSNGNAFFSGDITGANGTFSGTLSATTGSIGGILINESSISTPKFTLHSSGLIEAQEVNIEGVVKAGTGRFGTGAGAIIADSKGIYAGNGVGDPASTFWISSIQMADPRNPAKTIHAGDAFFSGSVSVSQDSIVDGGDLVIQEGNIIAGNRNGAHVRMSYLEDSGLGGEIYSQNESGETLFRVNRLGAYFKGDMTATSGSILGDLAVGPSHTVYLSGIDSSIYLYNKDREYADRIVRLNNDGLYISEDGGHTYSPAITGGGINANVIKDGVLTISDSGGGASGISIKQWNSNINDFVENISITPAGINVLNGAITVYSDQTGEVLIGGGYLRVRGLDMGVVTSNNYIGNGNFSMISEDYGVMQKTQGEVFLGKAQSSGGAVSNPTYHYVGWPDHVNRYPHTLMTYKIDEGGTINPYDPEQLNESTKWTGNFPNVTRVSFNPQWSAVHPVYEYCVVPNDACNFVTVIDKDGFIVRHLKAWRGGLFGADFTPDGSKLVVCGDDIDRKRSPWDMVVFDTSSPDPNDWHMIGNIPVGEFPSKVVCDDKGFAYVTVSLDNTVYKLDLNKMRVDSIMTLTDKRGIPVIPMPIAISNDYEYIFVGGVVSDFVYRIPTAFDQPFCDCYKRYSIIPYPGNRGIIHDLKVTKEGYVATSSASTTDACITLIDPDLPVDENGVGAIITWIDANATDRLAISPDASDEERENWNFFSSTTLCLHPTLKRIYVTVTNRCMVSTLDYSSGQLIEINRVPAGSNCSGVSISKDGSRLYVPNHHYHTYPLGANKVWGYRSSDNYYVTHDIFDTSQKYYHHNPSGMICTNNDRYVWVANRATNNITIIDTEDWDNENLRTYINDVGNKPYHMVMNNSKTKLFVSNDDSDKRYEPDFITIIDIPTRTIEGHIYVADRPMGIQIDPTDKYVYVACHDGKVVQKANITTRKVIASAHLEGKPTHMKIIGNRLYVTCFDTDELYCINTNDLSIIAKISVDNGPSQLETVNGKLYMTCQGSDNVMVFDIATNTLEQRIQTGSRPNPIAYNRIKHVLYVGNSGEGSVCIIDPDTNKVIEWCMTGDNPEFILVSDNGERWYVSAHGPEDIVYYGKDTPYAGDAYVDNSGNTHKYGAHYWMPSRSKWTRGIDNTLTSFSSVEFWPEEKLQGKQGYAHLTVMGMYDAYAQLEQDAYPLTNLSDGACDFITERIELQEGVPLKLKEEVADYRDLPGYEKRRIVIADAVNKSVQYMEDVHYAIDYEKNEIRRLDNTIPPSGVRQTLGPLNGTNPASMIENGYKYNTIKVFPLNQTSNAYKEDEDYVIDRETNTIRRTENSAIEDGETVTVEYRHILIARYYYHPNKRNYTDVVLSADMFWRWPRPENQWVRMEIDELIPKFINVDNDQIDPWVPVFDLGRNSTALKQYKGLRYSANTNRAVNANITTSAEPINDTVVDSIRTYDGMLELPEGEQYIVVDIGAVYYVNEIHVIHAADGRTINNARVEVSENSTEWTEVYNEEASPATYTITFPKTYETETYNGSLRIRYVKIYCNGSSHSNTNVWKQVKIMGDWKVNRSYTFSSNTIWDSEGKIETYLTLNGTDKVRFDDPTLTTNPQAPTTPPAQRVRYRIYYTNPDGTHNIRGSIQVYNLFTGEEYSGLRSDLPPEEGKHYDYIYDYINNLIWRTEDSNIEDGEEVRIVSRYVQEQLSNLPLCVAYKDPETGKPDPKIPASVAETDATGAWVEWEFENSYRCDWYIGWIADIGLGNVEIYLDDKLVHNISQSAAKVERFSQLTQDLLPGKHKIRLVQQQGRVNFDVIKLEDYQLYYTNSSLIASPSLNPVELFTWYTAKMSPGKARKYLGRGTQITSGAYETLRMDKETFIPNCQVPIKYRVRFKTTLEGRGEPIDGQGSYGGEAVGNEFKFERGSVMITSVTLERGTNPTYWRMAPAADKYPGFSIESWDINKPSNTGIQTHHLADGAVTSSKIKNFSIYDDHIANNANIQESKLALNYPTHPHENKDILDQISGFGSSGTSTKVARADHNHDLGVYKIVHRRPIYGYGGDLQFQTDSVAWEDLISAYNLFANGTPSPQTGYKRYYRLYAIYGDNISETDNIAPRLRIVKELDNSSVFEWKMPYTWGTANGRRDAFSPYFEAENDGSDHKIQIRIQNDAGDYAGGQDKEIGLEWLEIIAYDVLEEEVD